MTIRAKFKVSSYNRQAPWSNSGGAKYLTSIKLTPVTSGSEENKSFYAATPSGEITLGILPQDVADQFEIGDEFYVDFIKAPTESSAKS